MALGLALGALIGLSLGLLGGGGSILTVPIFVYVLGFGAKEAIALSLAVVGATSLFGAVAHGREGNVNVRVALVFGAFAMAGTYGGARLAVFFSGTAQLLLFAAVMLVAAVFMFRKSGVAVGPGAIPSSGVGSERDGPGGGGVLEVGPGAKEWGWGRVAMIGVEGIGVGVLTGLVGVGGGFLIVPALVLLGGLDMKHAVGTSLLVIALKSGAGFYGYLGQVEVPWGFLAGFTAVSVVGIVTGTRLVRHVGQGALRRAFAVFLVVMGVFIIYQNRAALMPGTATAEVEAVELGH